jgi:DNA-binding HxlR family transcriptional regulator
MEIMSPKPSDHRSESCTKSIAAVRDTLYVLSGKWKLPIIIALSAGPSRFKDLQRQLQDITPKVLSKELKELEMNDFVTRTVYATSPVSVEYELTKYSQSLDKIIDEMREWGLQHRRRMMANSRVSKTAREVHEL